MKVFPLAIRLHLLKKKLIVAFLLAFTLTFLEGITRHLLPFSNNTVQAQENSWEELERNLINEHILIRQNPQSYIPPLQERLESTNGQGNIPNGCGRNCTVFTDEGQAAVEEAIRYLQNQPPIDAELEPNDGISQAAKAHAYEQRNNLPSQTGSDVSQLLERMSRFGVDHGGVGESIAYGPRINQNITAQDITAQDIMVDLIIDDGEHRTNIFQPSWAMIGTGCGKHALFGSVCVVNYASAPRGTDLSGDQFRVVNNGTDELRSLEIDGINILNDIVPVGQEQIVSLENGCIVDLRIQLGGGYSPLNLDDLDLCAATLIIDDQNQVDVQ